MMDEAYGLIEDVNPVEIQDQIERNNLVEWCGAWKAAMRNAIGQDRKKGKWIITARNGILCSECKSGTRKMPTLFGNPLYKYCPFCGIKMEGKGVDE